MPRRAGPNFEDCNRIREYVEAGVEVEIISRNLNIDPNGVQIYVDSLQAPKPKPKTRRKRKTASEETPEVNEDDNSEQHAD